MTFANEFYIIEVTGPKLDAHVAIETAPTTEREAADELAEYLAQNADAITESRVTLINVSEGTARDVTEDVLQVVVDRWVTDDNYPQALDQFDQAQLRAEQLALQDRDDREHIAMERMGLR